MQHSDVNSRVRLFWGQNVPSASRICVAVSGGADSVALLHVLCGLQKELGIKKLGVAHVNHCLRGKESDLDAVFVRKLAQENGAIFHEKKLVKKNVPKTGIEEWARKKRYDFFCELREKEKYDFIATAHTADDQAETVLFRLLRGSGIRGLCAIAQKREDGIIRPFLDVYKQQLKEYLGENKLSWHEDSSNSDTTYKRNWIRHVLMPLIIKREPLAPLHLVSLAKSAAQTMLLIDDAIAVWKEQYLVNDTVTSFSISKKGLLHRAEASESLAVVLKAKGVDVYRLHIDGVFKNSASTGKLFLLPTNWKYKTYKERIDFYTGNRKKQKTESVCKLRLTGLTQCKKMGYEVLIKDEIIQDRSRLCFSDPLCAYFDKSAITGSLVMRHCKQKDEFIPFGRNKSVIINEFLKKQGLQKEERDNAAVICTEHGKIVWIVGIRTSNEFKVGAKTRSVVKISCKPLKSSCAARG